MFKPKYFIALLAVVLAMTAFGHVAHATSKKDTIGCTNGVMLEDIKYGKAGSTTLLGNYQVRSEDAGKTAELHLIAKNVVNPSVHQGNDLIVATGGDVVTFNGVEDSSTNRVFPTQIVTLGSSLSVTLQFGSDGVFSAGFELYLVCVTETPPTTAPPATLIPQVTETRPPTTQAPAPTPVTPRFTG